MRTLILAAATAFVLSGCATSGKDKSPICDGKHRRPANLYGSVLNPTPPPTSAPDPVKPQASADPQTSYRSCMV